MEKVHAHKVTNWLEKASPTAFAIYCIVFSFSTYLCVLAFRKPFTSGTFADSFELAYVGRIDYKVLLVSAQVFGYAFSKFLGIKFVSEASRQHRKRTIIAFVLGAQACFTLFPFVSAPYNAVLLFLNGISLGMIWGLVVSYLEGRTLSDLLGPGLSASFIVGSGVVKSAGSWVLGWGISEAWMPAVTGALFFPLTYFCVSMLDLLPPPTPFEEATRTKRRPMQAFERHRFLKTFAPGLVLLTFLYVIISAFKDFRDSFARELWQSLEPGADPSIFTLSETPAAFAVLLGLGTVVFLRDDRRSFNAIFAIMILGCLIIGASTWGFEQGIISPRTWMIVLGAGCYLAYVPFGCMLYDNLIGLTGFVGTAAFMISVSDAFGYLGSVVVMLYKNLGHPQMDWVAFFVKFSYFTSIACGICFALSYFYFMVHRALRREPEITDWEIYEPIN